MATEEWVSISSADAEDDWELTGEELAGDPLKPKMTDLGFEFIDEFETPNYVISQYEESKLPSNWLSNFAYMTINRIVRNGVDNGIKDVNLWDYYGGPTLMRASEKDARFALYAFKLAAALQLEGISVQEELGWGCENFKLDYDFLREELKKQRHFKWKHREQTVSTTKELHEQLVENAFAAFVPKECVSALGENLVISHRIYRAALTEAMGKDIATFRLMMDRPQALSQLVKPLLNADPLAIRLGKVNLRFNNELSLTWDEKSTFASLGFLSEITRQTVESPDGLFRWCNGEFICLRESLGDDKLDLARAIGRFFALRSVEGLGWGMRFPKEYLGMLVEAPTNKFLAAIRQGFSEVVGLDHVGEFKELVAGPKDTISLTQLKAAVVYATPLHEKHQMMVDLWKVVDKLDQVGLRIFIFMLTGSASLGRQEMDIIERVRIDIMVDRTPFVRFRDFELRLQYARPLEEVRSNLLAALGV